MKKNLIMGAMLFTLGATSMPTFAQDDQQDDLFNQTKALKAENITDGAVIAFKGISVTNANWVNFSGASTTSPVATGIFMVEDDPNDETGKILLKRASDGQYIGRNGENIKFVADKANATSFTVSAPALDNTEVTVTSEVSLPDWATDGGYQIRFATGEGADETYLNIKNTTTTPAYANGKGSWSIMMAYDASDKLEAYYPFEISEAPVDGTFSEDTHWYQLTLRNKYATYSDGQENVTLTATQPQSKGSFWAFVRNTKGGLEIYNAEAGANKVLTLSLPQTDKAPVYMAEKSEAADPATIATWSVKIGDGVFYLKNTKEENAYFLNDADNANIIKVWQNVSSGTDGGSQFRISEIDASSLISGIRNKYAACQGAVGTLVAEDYQKLTDALNTETVNGYLKAMDIEETGTRIQFESNKWYRIMNSATDWDGWTGRKYLTAGSTLTATDLVSANASQIWKIGSAEDKYTLESQGVYSVAPVATGTNVASTNEEHEAAQFTMAPRAGQYSYSFMVGSMYLHFKKADHESINGFDGVENASFWYLYPATTIDLTISNAGYATVEYPFAVELPADGTLKAYTGTTVMDGTTGVLNLNEVSEGVVPANTPVILKGEAKTYTLTIASDNATDPIVSDLKGTLLSETVGEGINAYVLGKGTQGVGFYQMSGTDRTMGANKAYLVLPQTANAIRSITIGGPTTGIENTVAEGTAQKEYYDLQGRRVMNPSKGIYVTKSGKKVVFGK